MITFAWALFMTACVCGLLYLVDRDLRKIRQGSDDRYDQRKLHDQYEERVRKEMKRMRGYGKKYQMGMKKKLYDQYEKELSLRRKRRGLRG